MVRTSVKKMLGWLIGLTLVSVSGELSYTVETAGNVLGIVYKVTRWLMIQK